MSVSKTARTHRKTEVYHVSKCTAGSGDRGHVLRTPRPWKTGNGLLKGAGGTAGVANMEQQQQQKNRLCSFRNEVEGLINERDRIEEFFYLTAEKTSPLHCLEI